MTLFCSQRKTIIFDLQVHITSSIVLRERCPSHPKQNRRKNKFKRCRRSGYLRRLGTEVHGGICGEQLVSGDVSHALRPEDWAAGDGGELTSDVRGADEAFVPQESSRHPRSLPKEHAPKIGWE